MTDEWSIALNLKNYEKIYQAATRYAVLATELILVVANSASYIEPLVSFDLRI